MVNPLEKGKGDSEMNNKRLYRSSSDVMLGGVAAGLGDYFEMDPTVMRLLFVLVAFMTGVVPVVPAYLALWVVMPRKPMEQ
jgi:phage shock protein PspC (stress-responsive transcriptional regulator)